MKKDGHNVAVIANYGLEAMQTQWEGINIYPRGYESYSNDVVAADFADWQHQHPNGRPHVFVLFDAWTMVGPHWDTLPTSIWTMVDHMPVPPEVLSRLKKTNITPIAVSRFGQREIERLDIESPYIPMAIDTRLYKPTEFYDNGGKNLTGRHLMGFTEDHFVVSLINANKGVLPSRKAWGENILAFSIFADKHPDAVLYLHTEKHGNVGGIRLDPLIKAVGLKDHQYKFVNQYAMHSGIPNEAMAAIYTASDVLLASTLGEGFGLTVLEAQACGTPVIVNNFSAQPELVGDPPRDRLVVHMHEGKGIFTNPEHINHGKSEGREPVQRGLVLYPGNDAVALPVLHPVRHRVREAARPVEQLPVPHLSGVTGDAPQNLPPRSQRGLDEEGDSFSICGHGCGPPYLSDIYKESPILSREMHSDASPFLYALQGITCHHLSAVFAFRKPSARP
jgi:glycosyltransferase involved in cell wall biosynthesis